jgi:hypothetical protein
MPGSVSGKSCAYAGGVTYLYQKGDIGAWPSVPTVTVPDPAATVGNFFGQSLSTTGDSIFVGSAGAIFVLAG